MSAHTHESEPGRVIPDEKLSGNEGKIVPSPRIGAVPKDVIPEEKERLSKPVEPELRRRICGHGPCNEPEPKPVAADLRRPICKEGECLKCPPGESQGKNGKCVTNSIADASNQCQPGEFWNGNACVGRTQCQPGEFWDGAGCVSPGLCTTFSSRAGSLTLEAWELSEKMRRACNQIPTGQECSELRQQHEGALLRYRMLLNEAPPSCRTMLPDPMSL